MADNDSFIEHSRYSLLLDEVINMGTRSPAQGVVPRLDDALRELTPREEKVLRARFGVEDGRKRTLREIGQQFGVTRERIRCIQKKALRKLRHPVRFGRILGMPDVLIKKLYPQFSELAMD